MSDTSTEPEDEFSFWRTCPHEQHPLVRDLRQGRHAIASVIRGHRRLQMLCSDGGLGKNHLVESVARECGIGRQDIVFMLPISVASLYLALWRARDAKFVVINENESMAKDDAMINMIKLASEKGAAVAYESVPIMRNEAKDSSERDPLLPPSRFKFHPGMLWLAAPNPLKYGLRALGNGLWAMRRRHGGCPPTRDGPRG